MAKIAQNIPWGRLLAEGAVIVISILLAFAVDAWWGYRQDRALEASYLRQLEEDVENTLKNNDTFSRRAERLEWPSVRLVQSYYEAESPHADSVILWLSTGGHFVVQPRLGTMQMLVTTGDLRLIRNDSLRASIPNYLTNMLAFEGFEAVGAGQYEDARLELDAYIDFTQLRIERQLIAESNPLGLFSVIPVGPTRNLPHQDYQALVRNPDVHRILTQMLDGKQAMRRNRNRMKRASEQMLLKVKTAQEELG